MPFLDDSNIDYVMAASSLVQLLRKLDIYYAARWQFSDYINRLHEPR